METGDDGNIRLELDELRRLLVTEANPEADVKALLWTKLVKGNTQLQRAIERFHHAEKWKAYLDIPVPDVDPITVQSPSREDLRVILSRFDKVARLEKYKHLTSMAIFQRTRDQLSIYISLADDS